MEEIVKTQQMKRPKMRRQLQIQISSLCHRKSIINYLKQLVIWRRHSVRRQFKKKILRLMIRILHLQLLTRQLSKCPKESK